MAHMRDEPLSGSADMQMWFSKIRVPSWGSLWSGLWHFRAYVGVFALKESITYAQLCIYFYLHAVS